VPKPPIAHMTATGSTCCVVELEAVEVEVKGLPLHIACQW